MVINGPGFKQNQINDLKSELEEIEGVYIVDLHQYDWSEIDTGWKIDGKDISIKSFFKHMYNMTDEQRTYFAIEIDTFRLIALALLKQFTKHEGGIYIDFDSLSVVDGHIGKDITIPKKILLGSIMLRSKKGNCTHLSVANMVDSDYDECKKSFGFCFNNDCIVIGSSDVIVDIFSRYKGKILSHKEIFNEVKAHFKRCLSDAIDNCKQAIDEDSSYYFDMVRRIFNLESEGIPKLYDIEIFQLVGQSINVLNLAQASTLRRVDTRITKNDRPMSTCKLFLFSCNNGNYDPIEVVGRNNLSWTKREKLYREQKLSNKLEKVKVDQIAVERLSLR